MQDIETKVRDLQVGNVVGTGAHGRCTIIRMDVVRRGRTKLTLRSLRDAEEFSSEMRNSDSLWIES